MIFESYAGARVENIGRCLFEKGFAQYGVRSYRKLVSNYVEINLYGFDRNCALAQCLYFDVGDTC